MNWITFLCLAVTMIVVIVCEAEVFRMLRREAESAADLDHLHDLLARYSKVIAELHATCHNQGETIRELEKMALRVEGQGVQLKNLRDKQEEDAQTFIDLIGNLSEKVDVLDDRAGDFQHILCEHQAKLDAIPVEQMQENAKKEEAFFQGVQNIMDYSVENVARLNIGGVTHE